MRRFVAVLLASAALAVGPAGSALADKPANRGPADRGKKTPVCTLGLEVDGSRTCIVP